MSQYELHDNNIVDAILHGLDGDGIRVLMEYYSATYEHFGNIVDVDEQTIRDWVDGKSVPTDIQRRRIGKQMNNPLFSLSFFRKYLKQE